VAQVGGPELERKNQKAVIFGAGMILQEKKRSVTSSRLKKKTIGKKREGRAVTVGKLVALRGGRREKHKSSVRIARALMGKKI